MKILAMTSVTLFSLLSLFMGAAAWFQSNRNVNGNADALEITNIQDFASLEIHAVSSVDTESGSSPIYTFNSTAAYTIGPDGKMTSSVPLSTEANPFESLTPYHPLLFIVRYDHVIEDQLYIRGKTDKKFICPIAGKPAVSETITGEEEERPYPLSSVVCFHSKVYETDTDLINNSTTVVDPEDPENPQVVNRQWTYVKSEIEDSDAGWTTSSFATLSGNTPDFNQQIVLESDSSGTTSAVAIIVEYNIDVLNYISGYYIGEDFITTNLPFSCDWILEI